MNAQYKCRLCGETTVTDNFPGAIAQTMMQRTAEKHSGWHVSSGVYFDLYRVHNCESGCQGLMDLQGIVPDYPGQKGEG